MRLEKLACGMAACLRAIAPEGTPGRSPKWSAWRRAVGLLATLMPLTLVPAAQAAPSDCMGTSSDGTAKCTAPVISPVRYAACTQTLLAYVLNAEDRCYARTIGTNAPITSEAQLASYISCLPPETNSSTPAPNIAFSWASPGETIVDNNLCWTITAAEKYGVAMRGWDFFSAQDLSWGWNVVARRDRTAQCPRGYTAVGNDPIGPDYCIKPVCSGCLNEYAGNPISIATGEKKVFETDYAGAGASPLKFARSYSNYGHYRPVLNASGLTPGFGDFWRHSYSRRAYSEGSGSALWYTVLRPSVTEKSFRPDGKEVLNIDGRKGDSIAAFGAGLLYRSASEVEVYSDSGALLSITERSGRTQTMTYSTSSTPSQVAPGAGFLIGVADSFGRSLSFTYGADGRLATMTDPDGGVFRYTFDGNEMLTRVEYPDGTARTYTYNETSPFASAGGPYAISGIYDENGARYATYRYRDGYWNTPDSTEHGNGVEKYMRVPNGYNAQGDVVSIIDPLGTTRNYTISSVSGVVRVIGETQPAGSGSGAGSSSRVIDASGNVTGTDDFNGGRTCRSFDAITNLESVRVEGLATSQACSGVTSAGVALPAGSRKVTTTWHPDWPLPTKIAEPGRFTTKVYNGRPDPFAGNAIASCAPTTALLPDGKPIAVLCKQVEQATTDADGRLGMSASLQAGVANRVRSWTYNAQGQVLTAKDPLNRTTSYVYYAATAADYTMGDLQSVTNAKSQVTSFTKYNKHGQLLESVDPNGVLTVNTYDLRQRLLSTSAGGQTTSYAYDPAGQLVRVTQPDASYVGYEYDAAHRQKAVFDSKGNRIDYTLDNMGNRTAEVVKDPNGTLARSVARMIDALNRLQSVTGVAQ